MESRFDYNFSQVSTIRQVSMNIEKIAGRASLVVLVAGLVLGLFLAIYGNSIAAQYASQGGGGLAALFGWAIAGIGYLIMGCLIVFVGLPLAFKALASRLRQNNDNNSDENDAVHTETAESDCPKPALDPKDNFKF
jgi:hypothetical protein